MRDRQLRAASRHGEASREIAKRFRTLHARCGHGLHRLWTDWIASMALAIANGAERSLDGEPLRPAKWQERENEYMRLVQAHGAETMNAFAEMFALLIAELEDQRADVLGSLYMALELGSDSAGQYFTPASVCEVMARMTCTIDDLRERVEEQGFVTFGEPAIGGGATIYPLIDIVREAGLDPARHMHVVGVDVDQVAVRMAYVQLSMLGVPAVLYHGNSLTMEMRDDYYTPAHVLFGWSRKLARKTSNSTVSEAIDRARAMLDSVAEPDPLVPKGSLGQLALFEV